MINGFEMIFSSKEKRRILSNINKVLDAGMVIDYKFHNKLRERLLGLTNKEYCDFSSSNTMVSEILYRSLSKKKVFFQGNMFVSPIFAARRAGMEVEFVDIELNTLGMNLDELKKKNITDNAVCIMHTGGVVSDNVNDIRKLCDNMGSIFIEDCAQSFGSFNQDKHSGYNSHFGTFSFASTKIFTSVAGGAVVHNDSRIHDLITGYTNCGKRVPFGDQTCDLEGFSARLTEIQSAILCGLDLEWRLKVRKKCSEIYYNELKPLEGKAFRRIYFLNGINNYRLFLLLNDGDSVIDFERYANKEGWQFSPPVFRELPYKTPVMKKEFLGLSLPITEDFCSHHVCLPVHEGMKVKDAIVVAKSAKKYLQSKRDKFS